MKKQVDTEPRRSRPRLPHERDQDVDSSAEKPDPVIKRALHDLDEGQVDTDMHATPGLDAERRKKLVRRQR